MNKPNPFRREHPPGSARELLAANIGRDPFEGVHALHEAGNRKARAEGVAYQLEAETKIMLARIMNELASVHADEKLSEAKLERLSRADPRYAEHIRKTAAAVEEKALAWSEVEAIRSELEWDGHASYNANAMSRLSR